MNDYDLVSGLSDRMDPDGMRGDLTDNVLETVDLRHLQSQVLSANYIGKNTPQSLVETAA